MASNLSTLGFVFSDAEDFSAAMVRLAGEARERLAAGGGEYAIWRSRTGAEIWFQFGPGNDGEIIGLSPFFEGVSEVSVKITAAACRPGDTPLEGACTCWVAPESCDDGSDGAYPLVFEAVDFAAHGDAPLPYLSKVRLAGFARQLTAFASEEAYFAQEPAPTFAAQSFVPMGMFAPAIDEELSEPLPPASAAMLTGYVVEHNEMTNEATGRPFHWLLVKSADATFDIVADPSVIVGDIVIGGTVDVVCQMFGRMLES